MDTVYNIAISIRMPQGMMEIGTFFIGPDSDFANSVFDSLEGDLTSTDDALIRIDLERKDKDTLPVLLKSTRCTLNQYAENCKIIIRDVFKFFALEK